MQRWSKIYLTPKYLAATFLTVVTPLVLLEFMSREIGLSLFVFFGFLSAFGRSVGRLSKRKWRAAESLWPAKLPEPLVLALRDALGAKTFIETGTFRGATAEWASS